MDEITELMDAADVEYTEEYGEPTYDNLMKLLGEETTESTETTTTEDGAAAQETAPTEEQTTAE